VQVWNLPYTLKEFLAKSKSASEQKYKQFEEKEVLVNSIPGIFWDYTVITQDNKSFKGNEVFLKKDDKMYRISYFVPENLWNKKESNYLKALFSHLKSKLKAIRSKPLKKSVFLKTPEKYYLGILTQFLPDSLASYSALSAVFKSSDSVFANSG